MKIAWLSPLPPVRSGIAGYSMMLLPEIAKLADVTAVVDQELVEPRPPCRVIGIEEYRTCRKDFDVTIAQIGNNLHHEFVWEEARERPMILVLHELVLHHLLTEMTLARGQGERFVSLMRESEGRTGEAFARARADGIHFENGNFLFPGSSSLAANSEYVIVHNEWARNGLLEKGVGTPIRVIDHPLDQLHTLPSESVRNDARRRYGVASGQRLVGMFGFVTGPKRPEAVFEAFGRALRRNPMLRLLVVGESAPNVDLEELASRHEMPPGSWNATGWTSDEEFDAALVAVDRVVALRYPSAGESSGAIVRVFAAGRPIAVSDYAQFADYPDDVVTRIPLGGREVEALERFMIATDDGNAGKAQREWIEIHGDPVVVAREYLEVVSDVVGGRAHPESSRRSRGGSTLGLLPDLSVEGHTISSGDGFIDVDVILRNTGELEIRSHVWGAPAYRVIVKAFAGRRELASSWWELPGDLPVGGSARLKGRLRSRGGDRVAFLHGWIGLPLVDETPFFEAEVSR